MSRYSSTRLSRMSALVPMILIALATAANAARLVEDHPSAFSASGVLPKSSSKSASSKIMSGQEPRISSSASSSSKTTSSASAPPKIEYTPDAAADRVLNMPGWGRLETFKMFSGYVTVDEDAGRALFYVMVESENSPATDPLMLWLNGGPGCSSLGGGFMSELGPFLPNKDGHTLQANPYPWNRAASLIFLESPAFVGWSYSNTSTDSIVGDARTARDSRAFLLGLMERFPHLRTNELFLSGESYAGHYVPNLAREVVRGNRAARSATERLNLKGFLVGNPWTDAAIDNLGAVDYWWHHAMLGDETAAGMRQSCNFSRIGPLARSERGAAAQQQEARGGVKTDDQLCDELCDMASDELGNINIYEIYADACLPRQARSEMEALAAALGPATPAGFAARIAASRLTHSRSPSRIESTAAQQELQQGRMGSGAARSLSQGAGYDPCVDNEVQIYMNLPEVQRALHANQTVVLPWPWTDCSRRVQYSREDLLASMLPVYQELVATGNLRILVFSGDVDGIVPVVGTRRWVTGLGLKTTSAWRPWTSSSGQVAGHIVEYEGVTFATVRNAGHMVPYVQPERMFHLLTTYLGGQEP